MEQIIESLKNHNRNYKNMVNRTQKVESCLQTLLHITNCDNYGNLVKKIQKWSKERE